MASYSDTQTWRVEANVCPNFACWAKSVIIASIVSGIAFAMFQMIFTWFARGLRTPDRHEVLPHSLIP